MGTVSIPIPVSSSPTVSWRHPAIQRGRIRVRMLAHGRIPRGRSRTPFRLPLIEVLARVDALIREEGQEVIETTGQQRPE